ncbi:MAG: hypothetical protein E7378_00675 [Clostridiales bacterium]|nr:hypothetical protein [Clostridiales bacterium]
MAKYTVKKGLFGKKLVDKNGSTLELKHCSYRVMFEGESFYFIDSEGNRTPNFISIAVDDVTHAEALTESGTTLCDINLRLGYQSPEYLTKRQDGQKDALYIGVDGEVFKLSETLKKIETGLYTKVNESGYLPFANYGRISVRSVDGKCGIINYAGDIICPLVFDELFIRMVPHSNISEFATNNQYALVDAYGNIVYIKQNTQDIIHVYDDKSKQLLVRDKSRGKSAIFKLNPNSNIMEKHTVLNCEVVKVISLGDKNYYITVKDNMYGIVDELGREILPNEYTSCQLEQLNGKEYVLKIVGQNGKVGAFDLTSERIVAEVVYNNIDFSESAKVGDVYRFFASDGNGYWGVVNSNGLVEVPFEFYHSTHSKVTTYRKTPSGKSISELKIRDSSGEIAYFNIHEPNIIATAEEILQIQEYEAGLRRLTPKETKRPETKEAQKYSEDEKIAAATFASLLSESPIAGMYVYGMMDEAEKD